MEPWASPGQASGADLAVRLPLGRATAVLESITAREDMVSVQLYGYPWIFEESWPLIAPCFRVTAVDDTGAEHEGGLDNGSWSPAHEGSGAFWFWPPVDPQARQLELVQFQKDVALAGAALLIFGLLVKLGDGLGLTITGPLFR